MLDGAQVRQVLGHELQGEVHADDDRKPARRSARVPHEELDGVPRLREVHEHGIDDAVDHESREAGAEIHEFQPTMFHCKVLVVDGLWVSVGSTNFDNRSFRLNDEANLNVYDREFAQRQIADFERDLARSRRVTLEEWKSRPLGEKALEHFVALFRGQL